LINLFKCGSFNFKLENTWFYVNRPSDISHCQVYSVDGHHALQL
jgi:hypothetical protein